jgi:hypothetical protein
LACEAIAQGDQVVVSTLAELETEIPEAFFAALFSSISAESQV